MDTAITVMPERSVAIARPVERRASRILLAGTPAFRARRDPADVSIGNSVVPVSTMVARAS